VRALGRHAQCRVPAWGRSCICPPPNRTGPCCSGNVRGRSFAKVSDSAGVMRMQSASTVLQNVLRVPFEVDARRPGHAAPQLRLGRGRCTRDRLVYGPGGQLPVSHRSPRRRRADPIGSPRRRAIRGQHAGDLRRLFCSQGLSARAVCGGPADDRTRAVLRRPRIDTSRGAAADGCGHVADAGDGRAAAGGRLARQLSGAPACSHPGLPAGGADARHGDRGSAWRRADRPPRPGTDAGRGRDAGDRRRGRVQSRTQPAGRREPALHPGPIAARPG